MRIILDRPLVKELGLRHEIASLLRCHTEFRRTIKTTSPAVVDHEDTPLQTHCGNEPFHRYGRQAAILPSMFIAPFLDARTSPRRRYLLCSSRVDRRFNCACGRPTRWQALPDLKVFKYAARACPFRPDPFCHSFDTLFKRYR
jgi:hypothetical protein